MATKKIGRDAGTGQFKPVKEAQKDKKGSVVETIKTPSFKEREMILGNAKLVRDTFADLMLADETKNYACAPSARISNHW